MITVFCYFCQMVIHENCLVSNEWKRISTSKTQDFKIKRIVAERDRVSLTLQINLKKL